MKAARFDYFRPESASEAADMLQKSNGMGRVLGGGQSLGPMMNLRLAQPELLVDVHMITALKTCVVEQDAVILGLRPLVQRSKTVRCKIRLKA